MDAFIEVLVGKKVAKGLGGGRKPAGHTHPGGIKVANHFAQ